MNKASALASSIIFYSDAKPHKVHIQKSAGEYRSDHPHKSADDHQTRSIVENKRHKHRSIERSHIYPSTGDDQSHKATSEADKSTDESQGHRSSDRYDIPGDSESSHHHAHRHRSDSKMSSRKHKLLDTYVAKLFCFTFFVKPC